MTGRMTGSLQNRILEDHQFVPEIVVGTEMTEYLYSDRNAYEVVEVRDQKHIRVRPYSYVKHDGGEWELGSDARNPVYSMAKRGKYWYWEMICTKEDLAGLEGDESAILRLCLWGFNLDAIREKGKQARYSRAHVSFGVADYYRDPSF